MSAITKERVANLLQFNSEGSDCHANAEQWEVHELARIALASLEAEAVCVIDQANLDCLNSGSDADVWPASRTEMGDVLLYRSAPPAPVSVPDEVTTEDCPAFVKYDVTDVDEAWSRGFSACRAAMLQGAKNAGSPTTMKTAPALDSSPKIAESPSGNSQVIPHCSCRTCRPVTMTDMRFVVCPDCGNKRCPHANDHRNACSGSNEPGQEGIAYPAAPQQEV